MIKLIASDMDGTLLDDSKKLPYDFDSVITALSHRNICFAVASGRSFTALEPMFEKYLDTLTFICDNGAYIFDRGKLVYVSVIPHETVCEISAFCEQLGLTVLLCGKNGTWHNAKTDTQHKEIARYYINQCSMDNISECTDEIFKIAVFEENGIENDGYKKLCEKFGENCAVQLSGFYWCDIMNKGISKGVALKTLQKNLDVKYEETMAFGDFLNDDELLKNAYYSFAMSNAHPTIKETANFLTGSNNENSVMKEIRKYCL